MKTKIETEFKGYINGVEINNSQVYYVIHDIIDETEKLFEEFIKKNLHANSAVSFDDDATVIEVLHEINRMNTCANADIFSWIGDDYAKNIKLAAMNICNNKKLKMNNSIK